ncbi:MAG: hypothetical protein ICV55_16150, partial [Coleofasciculus sp. C3-bin4]|nr:hypothetical protein [Coleofasciculus sp. C3-bin4]
MSQGSIYQDQLECLDRGWQYSSDRIFTSVPALSAACAIPENQQIKSFHWQAAGWMWLGRRKSATTSQYGEKVNHILIR